MEAAISLSLSLSLGRSVPLPPSGGNPRSGAGGGEPRGAPRGRSPNRPSPLLGGSTGDAPAPEDPISRPVPTSSSFVNLTESPPPLGGCDPPIALPPLAESPPLVSAAPDLPPPPGPCPRPSSGGRAPAPDPPVRSGGRASLSATSSGKVGGGDARSPALPPVRSGGGGGGGDARSPPVPSSPPSLLPALPPPPPPRTLGGSPADPPLVPGRPPRVRSLTAPGRLDQPGARLPPSPPDRARAPRSRASTPHVSPASPRRRRAGGRARGGARGGGGAGRGGGGRPCGAGPPGGAPRARERRRGGRGGSTER